MNDDPLQAMFPEYGGGEAMPLTGYAALMGVFSLGAAGLFLALQPDAGELRRSDLGLLSVSTFQLTSLIAHDRVTAPLRAPFTRYVKNEGRGVVKEEAAGTGLRRAVGDLLTCPYCLGVWVATGMTLGFLKAPRASRFAATVLGVVAASDLLHRAHEKLGGSGPASK